MMANSDNDNQPISVVVDYTQKRDAPIVPRLLFLFGVLYVIGTVWAITVHMH